jgi:hypothetical protein
MQIAIFNQSTMVDDADVAAMTQAIATQVQTDAAVAWGREPAAVEFYADASAIPAGAHVITVTDTIKDQPSGVLGFHTEDPGGRLWGTVAVDPELTNGAQVTTGDWSVSSVLSHEVLEMFIDPNCNLWSNAARGRSSRSEVCDRGGANIRRGRRVCLLNFVTPAWFDS